MIWKKPWCLAEVKHSESEYTPLTSPDLLNSLIHPLLYIGYTIMPASALLYIGYTIMPLNSLQKPNLPPSFLLLYMKYFLTALNNLLFIITRLQDCLCINCFFPYMGDFSQLFCSLKCELHLPLHPRFFKCLNFE